MNNAENKTVSPVRAKHAEKEKREPFIHITKRNNLSLGYSIGLRASAIICSVLVMFVLILILTDEKPTIVLKTMIEGLFGKK